jgi:hypothetical protein
MGEHKNNSTLQWYRLRLSYDGYLNGNWILFEYDTKQEELPIILVMV